MTTRIHAMYQGSKKMLVFLGVVLLTCTITSGVMTGIGNIRASAEEVVLSGNRMCLSRISNTLNQEIFLPTLVWEVIALFLAAWIVIKHIRELRQSQTGSTIGDCFTVLMESHVLYFVGFVAVTCFNLGTLSPTLVRRSV
ncbi:hypothetical protein BDR05DRAFT_966432 [Suillus weaverae]|nr:hypothetical protein BDR05DRAFT_966432 [Suillus weaverae]